MCYLMSDGKERRGEVVGFAGRDAMFRTLGGFQRRDEAERGPSRRRQIHHLMEKFRVLLGQPGQHELSAWRRSPTGHQHQLRICISLWHPVYLSDVRSNEDPSIIQRPLGVMQVFAVMYLHISRLEKPGTRR